MCEQPLVRVQGLVIKVGSAALKPALRNYSALEQEATCVSFVWGIQNKISNALPRAPVGGSRGHRHSDEKPKRTCVLCLQYDCVLHQRGHKQGGYREPGAVNYDF